MHSVSYQMMGMLSAGGGGGGSGTSGAAESGTMRILTTQDDAYKIALAVSEWQVQACGLLPTSQLGTLQLN